MRQNQKRSTDDDVLSAFRSSGNANAVPDLFIKGLNPGKGSRRTLAATRPQQQRQEHPPCYLDLARCATKGNEKARK